MQPPERIGVLFREAGERRARLLDVGVNSQRGAVAEDAAHLYRWLDVFQAVVVQLKVVVHRADPHQGVVVTVQVVEKAGSRQLFSAEAAALFRALLEDRHVPAGLRQVSTQGESVVARADDYRVERRVGHSGLLIRLNLAPT